MLVSPVSVKSIFLKTEDLFRVLKMVSLWTPLIKIIIFFWTKCFDSEILKEFCAKRKELISVSISSLTRQIQATCCFLYYLGVKKTLFTLLFEFIATGEEAHSNLHVFYWICGFFKFFC